jgi:hypothetical protein
LPEGFLDSQAVKAWLRVNTEKIKSLVPEGERRKNGG